MIQKRSAPTVQVDEVVELRVHGVGESSPEGLLAHADSDRFPPPWKIAGDKITGFYRAKWDDTARKRVLEGYLWGGLTSRKASRALWLLLLPFSIANIAGWMIQPRSPGGTHPTDDPAPPPTGAVDKLARVKMGLVRLFAAAMTTLFLAWLGALLVDLMAYQCGAQSACTDGRVWMAPFTLPAIATYPARRMLLGAAALALLVLLLAILSFRSQNRYESETSGEDVESVGKDGAGLNQVKFWTSSEYV